MAAASDAKKRRPDAYESQDPKQIIGPSKDQIQHPALLPPTTSESEETQIQESPPTRLLEGEEGINLINCLPESIVGEIISLLPTKDARLISKIIDNHKSSVRHFAVSVLLLHRRRQTLNRWLLFSALNNLQELEFDASGLIYTEIRRPLLSHHVFCFSSTVCITTISECQMPDPVESFHFPQLAQLGLESVMISNDSLDNLITGCPILESLLLKQCYGLMACIRINSSSLKSIGFSPRCTKLVIEDAPMLERLLQLENSEVEIVMVISAPKLETKLDVVNYPKVGCCSVKILAISVCNLSLDMVISLMRYFPCMEKLYIELSDFPKGNNVWPREHHHGLIRCLDINLKKVVLKNYRGTESHSIAYNDKKQLIAMQQRLLELKKKASRGAHFYFTASSCHHWLPHIKHVHDLAKGDPFRCTFGMPLNSLISSK
uniref:F-box/LRR-repeat protein 15/At3g58940/PEG3-like LRR domain-containing protein n=1 Tax=Setaria italica TaxID=4555 RepID=K3Y3K5_SETIT